MMSRKSIYKRAVLSVLVLLMTAVIHFFAQAQGGNRVYLPIVSRSSTCTVPSVDYQTIQGAIDDGCDFIYLSPVTFFENIVIQDQSVVIKSEGPGRSTINGNAVDRVIKVEADAQLTLIDVIVTNGKPIFGYGGGIYNMGSTHLINSIVKENAVAGDPGGGIYSYGTLTVEDSWIIDNDTYFSSTGAKGGGVYVRGNAYFSNTVISGNVANAGGGLAVEGWLGDTVVTLDNSQVVDNEAWDGGGIRLYKDGAVIISNSDISNNSGWDAGGGILNGGDMQIADSHIVGNKVGDDLGFGSCGGGILNSGGSQASDDVGVLTIDRTEIRDNRSDFNGAGICNDRAPDNDPIAKLEIYNSLLAGNKNISPYGAYGSGGGLFSDSSVLALIENTTFYDNGGGGYGGAVAAIVAKLINVTVYKNGAPEGGGIYSMGHIELINSIIAGSVSGADCDISTLSDIYSLGHNIASDNSCSLNAAGDMPNTNPLLGILQDNGGPTWTLALLLGSPAIDAADTSACPATDQRGVIRPQGPACDIGAYEYNG